MKQGSSRLRMARNHSMFIQKFKGKISFVGPTGILEPFLPPTKPERESEVQINLESRKNSYDICRRKSSLIKLYQPHPRY